MDIVVFSVGEYQVNLGLALLLAVTGVGLALAALAVAVLRAASSRVEAAAKVEIDKFTPQIADRDARIRDMDVELADLRRSNTSLAAEAAGLRAQQQEQARQNQYIRSQMTDQFKLLAGDVLKSHGESFSKQNREQVEGLLKPLREKIGEFQKQAHEGRARLDMQMRALSEDSLRMSTEANNLTRALKGNSQAQGAWGEMILSSILERSGLREGEQFLTQQTHHTDGGERVRTDVEILFPNQDRLVVDSKVSLSAFEAYTNSEDEAEQARHLRDHVASLKSHIKSLGGKDYQVHANSGLNFVMMFVPIEAAFSVALEAQSDLIDFAIRQNVYITTPTTLMVALRTVANVWDSEKRNRNADEIARRAGALYDKVAGFLDNMDRLGKNLYGAQKSFEDAKNQLSGGRGSVVRQIEMLKELGAKSAKQMPPGWEPGADDDNISAIPEQLTSPDPETDQDEN